MFLFRSTHSVLISIFVISTFLLNGENNTFPESENIEIHFPQIIQIVSGLERNSPSLRKNIENIEEALSNRMIADSAQGITANLNVSTHSIHENRPGQDYYQRYRTVGSIYVKKPFFYWGALNAKSRIAELSENIALNNTIYSKSNLILHVKSEFLNLALLAFEVNLAQKIYKLRLRNVESFRQRNNLGLVTELQVDDAIINKLEQSIQLSELERILQNRKSNFIHDTGYKKGLDLNMSESFKKFYLNDEIGQIIPSLISSMSSNEIEQIKIQIETEDQNIIIAKSANKPKLNLVGGFFQDQIDLPENTNSVRRNNFLIGIEANWNLWDSYLGNGQKSLAMSRKRKFEIELNNKVKKLNIEIKNLQSQLITHSSRIKLYRRLVNSAKYRLEKSQIELEAKRITPTNHFEAEINVSNANLNLIRTVFTYMQLKLQYEQLLNFPKS